MEQDLTHVTLSLHVAASGLEDDDVPCTRLRVCVESDVEKMDGLGDHEDHVQKNAVLAS